MKGASDMKRIAILALLASTALAAFAVDLADYGFTKTGDRSEDGKAVSVLADASGGELILEAEAEPTAERAAALKAIVAEVRGWKSIKAAELRAVNTADGLSVTVLPSSFEAGGVSLAVALPGGIQLFFEKSIDYDFKVKSGKYLVRVASAYTTEAELVAAALSAFKDPASFAAARDPLYVQKRLDELAAKVETLEAAIFDSSADEAKTKAQEGIDALKAELGALKAQEEARDADRDSSWRKAKPALLAALNGGKPVMPELEAKILELKAGDAKLNKADLAKALKASQPAIKFSLSEIAAVLYVDFGEYYQ
jgi:hypothetical protein